MSNEWMRVFSRLSLLGTLCSLLLLALCVPARAAATDIYLSQSGGGNGSSCSSAQAVSFFNSSSNWGSGSNQIGPGTTVHLCGTITGALGSTILTTQGSGQNGSPITILFETNAVVQSPACNQNGCIMINSQWIVLDGGTNGIVQNTANGTSLPNHQFSSGIYITGNGSNTIIRNLMIANIYVHAKNVDDGNNQADLTMGIYNNANNVTSTHNTIHDVRFGHFWNCNGVCDTFVIDHDTEYNCDHGVGGGDNAANVSMTNWIVHDSDFHDMDIWDTPSDQWHHNFIHVWQTYSGSVIHMTAYNNYFHGNWGGPSCGGNGCGPTAAINNEQNVVPIEFNNVIVDNTPGQGAPYGCISMGQGSPLIIVNNTCVSSGQLGLYVGGSGTGAMIENNIFQGTTSGAATQVSSISGTVAIDDNDWYNDGDFNCPSHSFVNFLGWQSECHYDAHGFTSNPNLNSSAQPNAGSPLIGAGANLASLCLRNGGTLPNELCADKNGNSRPGVGGGAWDIGAYQFGGASPPACLNACDVNCDGVDNVTDVQAEINMALGKTTCTDSSGTCNVISVQKVINAALGGTCVAP